MTTDEKLAFIWRYYDGCSTGNVAAMLATLDENVVHYFLAPNPGSAPMRGAFHLANYWRKIQRLFEARWVVDSIIGEGDEAVIEWTMFHTPKPGGARVALRGAEFYRFANGRIAEIRAYYNQLDRSTGLEGFDYSMRGYSQLGREQSALHSSPRETKRSNDSHR